MHVWIGGESFVECDKVFVLLLAAAVLKSQQCSANEWDELRK